ncbi:MAG: glycosyltransferase [Planctomycetaceae bacterium]
MLLLLSIILFGIIAYTYAGYPLLLWLLCSLNIRRETPSTILHNSDRTWPEVSIVLAMHNAASLVETKLANLAQIDYIGKVTINFVLDGCSDETEDIIQRSINRGYRFPINIWLQSERRGKEAAIRNALPNLPGGVLMFSDADAELANDALRLLVETLLEEGVGVACGKEIHLSSSGAGAGSGQGLFYRYEHAIKLMQARFTSMTYVQGGVFAMWKALYPSSIPAGATQDGAIAFHTVLHGYRVVYVDKAESREPYDLPTSADFARRIRTVSRALYSVTCYPQIFLPNRCGLYGFHVMSSRFLRWMTVPVAAIANLMMVVPLMEGQIGARMILALELLWLILATIGFYMEKHGVRWKLPYFCYYFSYIHFAACMAVARVLCGQRTSVWKPTT